MMTKHTDLTFFTNEEGQTLLDRFKVTLKSVQFFDVLVGYFRSSGFYLIEEELQQVEKIRILVGINTNASVVKAVKQTRQQKLDYESHKKTKECFAEELVTEMDNSEDSFDVERGIKQFISFLQAGRLEIRAYPSQDIHAKLYIKRYSKDDRDYGSVITGSSNFSESGLKDQYEFNVELKNSADVRYAEERFNALWEKAIDVSEDYVDTVQNKTWLKDDILPCDLFLKSLLEYFGEEVNFDRDSDIKVPSNFKKLKYQTDVIGRIRDKIEKYNGVFISDVVGLGKTYITAMFAQSFQGKILVLAPPPVVESWENVFREFHVSSYDVKSAGQLPSLVKKTNPYDLIIVDEAHRFRTESSQRYADLKTICEGKKVMLVTATPLNNTFYDFYPLLTLFQNPLKSDFKDAKNLKGFFNKLKSDIKNSEEQEGKDSDAYLNQVKEASRQVRSKLLTHVMERRTRQDILTHYEQDIKEQGLHFPTVATPQRIIYEFDDPTNTVLEKSIHTIKELTYSRYAPLLYLQKKQTAFDLTQQRNMKGFIKSRMVKRLESSKYAFEQTLARMIESYEKFIAMCKKGEVFISKKIDVYDYLDVDNEEDLFKFVDAHDNNAKVKHHKIEEFNDKLMIDLEGDLALLKSLQPQWQAIQTDFKKEAFVKELQTNPTLKNKKVLIFTESKETGEDLTKALKDAFGESVMSYSSQDGKKGREIIEANYDPNCDKHYQKNDIQILVTTDVLAEGVNLHRCNIIINYDLPWNPTKVLQRVGRVNRVGTTFSDIHIFNIFPTAKTNEHLSLEESITAKIQAFHNALGEDAQYLSENEEFTSHGLFTKLNDTDTYQEGEEAPNAELKYLKLIRRIRDEDTPRFEQIQKLPKKCYSARTFEGLEEEALITLFKEGRHKKFVIHHNKHSQELDFAEAVRYFDCPEGTPKQKRPSQYHPMLEANKEHYYTAEELEAENHERHAKLTGTAKKVYEFLRALLNEPKLVDEQRHTLGIVLKHVQEDGYAPATLKKMREALERTQDNLQAYHHLMNVIPQPKGKNNQSNWDDAPRQVILSNALIPPKKDA